MKAKSGSIVKGNKENNFVHDPMAVRWTTKYNQEISKVWNYIPEKLGKLLATSAVFILGVSINGDWINVWVHMAKQFGYYNHLNSSTSFIKWDALSVESFKLQNLWHFWWTSCLVSYSMYLFIGGFIHWYYYVRQRDKPEEWKCQPQKWISPELEKDEIMWGCLTLFGNSTMSAILSCYISNGGYSTVYYGITKMGWLWFILQFPIIFIYQDYCTYWMHRLYHSPYLFKHFHKLHHKYKQPTAFSVTAIHPVESLHIQLVLAAPLFFLPVHWLPFYAATFYAYYHGILSHSGVSFKAYWWQPWQPDAMFHDNHHQYCHVNFAFNISYWDTLHGTVRRKDKIYSENIFNGKSITLATEDELKADLEERESENHLAYREKMQYKLSKNEIKHLKKNKSNGI